MRRDRGFLVALGALAVAALAVFFVVLLTLHGEARDEMVKEGGKAALQVFTVAVIGALLKQLADRYKEDRERDAQDRSFRQDKYDRLVEATNSLRAVRAFVYADKSFATWDAQMHQVVQAGLKLRTIKHQIWSSKSVPDPPFPDRRELTYLFEALYRYTDWVTDEYIDARASIEQASREAEAADTEIADGEVWRRIKSLEGDRGPRQASRQQ